MARIRSNELLARRGEPAPAVAGYLKEGALVLLLGAGVSRAVGLPLFWELVQRILKDAGHPWDDVGSNSDADQLRLRLDRVEQEVGGVDFLVLVERCLYDGIAEYTSNFLKRDLLIALGSLVIGARRGSIRTVLTFNYDDVLEWYLRLHGLRVKSASALPALLADRNDVTVYHPHGFLPRYPSSGQRSNFCILSQFSFDERMGKAVQDLWTDHLKNTLRSKVGLFVGLSGEDPIFGPLLASVKAELSPQRPTGFWLLTEADPKGDDYFLDRNVIPVRLPNHDSYPEFLLGVCQVAAGI